jgi:hypothetical protein
MVVFRQSGDCWTFRSESELEDFVWHNLQPLFGLSPLRRQYSVDGQFCDILAVSDDKQLVVIELKNVEDRYVVQQLTRYYHALSNDRSLEDRVDYSKPIRLVAIVPSIHKDNVIDCKYNQLLIELLTFELIENFEFVGFQLRDLLGLIICKLNIKYFKDEVSCQLPELARKWLKFIPDQKSYQDGLLRIRQKILKFNPMMKELDCNSFILYGKNKSHWCAELKPYTSSNFLVLLLRLPHPDLHRKAMIRAYIQTEDWVRTSHIISYPSGFKNGIVFMGDCYRDFDQCQNNPDSVDVLIDLALSEWKMKL